MSDLEDSRNAEPRENPWVCYGPLKSEHEDFLIGNREGFRELRRHIDEVLETGESRVKDSNLELNGLRLVADDPRGDRKVGPIRDAASAWGCGLLVFILVMVFIAGVIQIFHWVRGG